MSINRSPHLCCKKGKRVVVSLRDGSRFIDKFVERKGRYIFLEESGKIPTSKVRAFSIWRGQDI